AALVAVQVVAIGPRLLRIARDRVGVAVPKAATTREEFDELETLDEPADKPIRWSRIAVPWASFAVTVGGLQLMLPSVLFPHFAGTGTQQINPNIIWFRDILAEQLGLKDVGVSKTSLLGSWTLAAWALGLFVGLAVLGFIVRLLTATAEDAS